jgi:hypothetical protein
MPYQLCDETLTECFNVHQAWAIVLFVNRKNYNVSHAFFFGTNKAFFHVSQ